MPRGDGTGPMGMGSMTGRAGGYCAGNSVPGYMNPTTGRGMGCGFGRGRRFDSSADGVGGVLRNIQSRLSALEDKSKKDQ